MMPESAKSISLNDWIVALASIAAGVFHLYTGAMGAFSSFIQLGVHWLLLSIVLFLTYPIAKGKKAGAWYDWLFIAGSVITSLYVLLTWRNRMMGLLSVSTLEVILSLIMILVVMEGARRSAGTFLAITAAVFLFYARFGNYLPGILGHKGYTWTRILSFLCLTAEGIYGTALGVSATFIILFIFFGSFLQECGGGKFFIDLAFSFVGRFRGGPAKTAVVSSALMGTISGSPVANVVTTGTFTIPLMKKAGYRPEVAGAVEAVASTGGMIMPPIMGAAAFIMAEFLEIPYVKVAIAAFIPALLYYLAIFFIVDLEAAKHGLKGLPPKDLPPLKPILASGGHLLIPIIALVFFLLRGWSPMKTVFWSIVAMLVISSLRPHTRMSLPQYLRAFRSGVESAIPVASACACAGIVVGVVNLTGLGVKFSSSLMEISGGNLLAALVLTMITALILGCGLPATALYMILASLNAPALVKMGVLPIAAHMFVFYFGNISTITPPVALTAYAAAGIAKTDPNKVGWIAFMFGIVAYIVPYMFVYTPRLLMIGTAAQVITALITSTVGAYCLACAVEGWLISAGIGVLWRLLLVAAGMLLIHGGINTDVVGLALFALVIVLNYSRIRHRPSSRAL